MVMVALIMPNRSANDQTMPDAKVAKQVLTR
jgi:hypothetical protein